MKFLYNDPKLKIRRQELRQNETLEEKIIWNELRNCNIGCRFFRQYSVGPYILDFYCPKKRLAIELDGQQHRQEKEYDEERDNYLVANDIRVLRFWNKEVSCDLEKVLVKIRLALSVPPPISKGRLGGVMYHE